MANCLVAPRHLRFALVFLVMSAMTGARAQDAAAAAAARGGNAVGTEGGRHRHARQRFEFAGRRARPAAA